MYRDSTATKPDEHGEVQDRPAPARHQVSDGRSLMQDQAHHNLQSGLNLSPGTNQRSGSFTSIDRPEGAFDDLGPSYIRRPLDHQHLDNPFGSTSKSTLDKPQPRRYPSIGAVFGESSQHQLSTSRPIDRENLTTLPLPGDAPNPLGILAEATISLDVSSSSSDSITQDRYQDPRGVHAPIEGIDYYSSSKKSSTPRTLKTEAPHIMQLISPSDAESLFETYWKKIHPHLPVLDRARSACIDVASRSNYLFNASKSVSKRKSDVVARIPS